MKRLIITSIVILFIACTQNNPLTPDISRENSAATPQEYRNTEVPHYKILEKKSGGITRINVLCECKELEEIYSIAMDIAVKEFIHTSDDNAHLFIKFYTSMKTYNSSVECAFLVCRYYDWKNSQKPQRICKLRYLNIQ